MSQIKIDEVPLSAVTFSLYGDDPFYAEGVVENIALAKKLYPGWHVVVHLERGHLYEDRLSSLGVRVIEHEPEEGTGGMLWRFETVGMEEYTYVISRDADSRIYPREVDAVKEWISSGKTLHTMWDINSRPNRNISAGMFGLVVGRYPMLEELKKWKKENPAPYRYGQDEDFLNHGGLWERFKDDSINHRRFPQRDIDSPFKVGDSRKIGGKATIGRRVDLTGMRVYRITDKEVKNQGEIPLAPVYDGSSHEAGCAKAHLNAARTAIQEGVFPCVVLEEDATWIRQPDSHTLQYHLSRGEEWLWVGLSRHQLMPNRHGSKARGLHREVRQDGSIETGRMLATHGVAYLTEEGARRMIEAAERSIRESSYVDVILVEECGFMGWHRPALSFPWVYQEGKYARDTRFFIQ